MKEIIIGIVAGLGAVFVGHWSMPKTAPVSEVRELGTVWSNASLVELGKPMIPSTQADPALAKLALVLDRFEFKQKTFDEAISALSQRTGCNMFIDWPALEAAGIARDERSSLALQSVTASAALKTMLAKFDLPHIHMNYRAEEGIVRISTEDRLSQSTVVRVYDVRDLVQSQFDRQRQTKSSIDQPYDDNAAGEALSKVILQTVNATSWRNTGGGEGDVQYFGGRLIINQTPENHDTIYQLLAAMRRKQH